jgi:hypothetical protein
MISGAAQNRNHREQEPHMNRTLAVVLATAISLAGFPAVLAAISWFMHSASVLEGINYLRSRHISPVTISLVVSVGVSLAISVVLVPLLALRQQRRNRAEQIDLSDAPKPAPRLWMRSFQPPDE